MISDALEKVTQIRYKYRQMQILHHKLTFRKYILKIHRLPIIGHGRGRISKTEAIDRNRRLRKATALIANLIHLASYNCNTSA